MKGQIVMFIVTLIISAFLLLAAGRFAAVLTF